MAFQPGEGWASAGWANECGIELFTIGRLGCAAPSRCLPWIGSDWLANCVDQHYTLDWICCDDDFIPIPVVVLPPSSQPVGRGSGPTTGVKPEFPPGYTGQWDDMLRAIRRQRILAEDEDMAALIVAMVTKGLV
jgi:hypothetical protein